MARGGHSVIVGIVIVAVCFLLPLGCVDSCNDSEDSSPDINPQAACDLVANPDGPSYLEVQNTLNTGVEWYLADYAFGAFLRPGECTQFGLADGTYDLIISQCASADDYNCPDVVAETTQRFSVADGETHIIVVTADTF